MSLDPEILDLIDIEMEVAREGIPSFKGLGMSHSFSSNFDLENENELDFYGEKLKKYLSSVKACSGKIGKFCIVEKDGLTPIDYCPFLVKK